LSGGAPTGAGVLRAVLFDAGNTLIFLDYPRLAAGVGAAIGRPLTPADLEAQAAEAARRLEQGHVSDHERATAYLEALFLLAGVPPAQLPEVRDELLRLHQERHLWSGVQAGTADALERLARSGVRLGVVSNSDGRAEAALDAAGLRRYFEVVIDSALVGFEKPDPRIFQAGLQVLGVEAEETLYVGDIYEVDAVGARAAAMEVALIDPLGTHRERDVRTAPSVSLLVQELFIEGRLPPEAAAQSE
jgi:HAD superfamily hydrolase (TIGR01509 family)